VAAASPFPPPPSPFLRVAFSDLSRWTVWLAILHSHLANGIMGYSPTPYLLLRESMADYQ
jgi:hypothetical protein